MNEWLSAFERDTLLLVAVAVGVAAAMMLVVVIGRILVAAHDARLRHLTARYSPLIPLALAGDPAARSELVRSPPRHRITIARLILVPLIGDRDPARIVQARELVTALSIVDIAQRWLRSPLWWRRAMALRALGGMQAIAHTAGLVAALDDSHDDVRNTALDALADMQALESLPAIVARLHDASLHRARRDAALAAFGTQCESFLLDLGSIHTEHRLNYARALGICGSPAARPVLCEWSRDSRAEVRAAAMAALSRLGLDPPSVPFAIAALEDGEPTVRAMAAAALHDCADPDIAVILARHLDDTWAVAVRAARSLQTMQAMGRAELEARSGQEGLSGLLARQMIWEARR